jgi:ABC-type nickel/cobalt efflux system permease component RcnA
VHIDWSALGLVVVISLVAGCGLVTLTGFGIAAMDQRETAQEAGRGTATPTAVMILCFLGAIAIIGYGLYLVAFS